MNSGIYQITHLDTGRIYIGQSVNLSNRKQTHKRSERNKNSKSLIGNVIKKHGWDAFKFEVLVYAEGVDYLNLLEEKIISTFNSLSPNGFNIRSGGNVVKMADSTKEKLSKLRIEKYKDGSLLHIAGFTGKIHSEETKAKMKESHTGQKHSEAGKLKMKEAAKKRWANPEYRNKVLAAKGVRV